jgi:hypothetical protein
MDINEAMKNSPAVQKAIAYRKAILAEKPSKEQLKKAGIDPDAKRAEDVQAAGSEIVFTNDVSQLPPDASARVVTEGVIEVFHTSDKPLAIPDSVKITEKPTETASPAPPVAAPVSNERTGK